MQAIGCLLTFFITLIIAVLIGLLQVANRFFGIFRRMNPNQQNREYDSFGQKGNTNRSSTQKKDKKKNSQSGKQKLFDDNEGEYIDYVEIKDSPENRN